MALFVEDLLMSVLKVLWFSTMDNDNIGNNNISELVHETQPFILSPMIPWRLSARIVTLGWAAASWSKASLLLQNKLRVGGSQRRNVLMLRRVKSAQSLHVDDNNSNNTAITTNTNSDNDNDHDDDDDRKVFACYHLLVAYGVLRFLHSSKQSKDFGSNSRRRFTGWMLFAISVLTGTSVIIDEIVHCVLSHILLGPSVFTIKGDPPPKLSTDDDCSICLGVGPDQDYYCTSTNTAPSHGIDESSRVLDSSKLQSFCENSHVAHIGCMLLWIQSRRSKRKCMICRQPLVFKSVDDNTLVRDRGWSGLVEVIKSRFDWHDVMIRSSLTIGCTTGVIGFLVLKSMFDHQSLR